jgi:hypothetical protein
MESARKTFDMCCEFAAEHGKIDLFEMELNKVLRKLKASVSKSWADNIDSDEESDVKEVKTEVKEVKPDIKTNFASLIQRDTRPRNIRSHIPKPQYNIQHSHTPRESRRNTPQQNPQTQRTSSAMSAKTNNITPAFVKKEEKWAHASPVKYIDVKEDVVIDESRKKTTCLGWFVGVAVPAEKDKFLHALDSEGNPINWVKVADNIWKSNPKIEIIHIKGPDGTWYHFEQVFNQQGQITGRRAISVAWLKWFATPKAYRNSQAPSKY